ncbi:hypothetical protein CsatA_007183 [Cannabis sativa]
MSHRQVLMNFVQHDLEPLYEAWWKYKAFLVRFPYHGLSKECQLEIFLNGLNPSTRKWVERGDGTTNFYQLSIDEAYWMLEDMAEYNEWCCNCPNNDYVWEDNYNNLEPNFDTYTQVPNDEKLKDFQEFNIKEEPHQMVQPSSLEALTMEFMAKNDALIQSQASSLKKLENQFELLVNELYAKPHETLGIDMENSREKEENENVILRSGDELEILGENFEQLQELTSIQSSEIKDKEASIPSWSTFIAAHNAVALSQQNCPVFEKIQQEHFCIPQVKEPMVMEYYVYEDPFWPLPPPPPLAWYLGIHHVHSLNSRKVEHLRSSIQYLAKLEGVHDKDPFVRAYATLYGRKPLFDECFSKSQADDFKSSASWEATQAF